MKQSRLGWEQLCKHFTTSLTPGFNNFLSRNNPDDNSLRRILKEGNNRIGCCLAQYRSVRFGPSTISRLSCMYKEDANPYQAIYETGVSGSKCGPRNIYTVSRNYPHLCTQTYPLSVLSSSPVPIFQPRLEGFTDRRLRVPAVLPPQVRQIMQPVSRQNRPYHRNHLRRPPLRHSSRRSIGNIFNNILQQIPGDGHVNIGPTGIKYRRSHSPRAMAIANAGFNFIGNHKKHSKPFEFSYDDYDDLKKMLGSYEDYSDEDDGDLKKSKPKASVSVHGKEQKPKSNSEDLFESLKSLLPSLNDPRVESSYSMEVKTEEHDFPIETSAIMKSMTCDIDGVIVQGPMSPEECFALIKKKALEPFNQMQPDFNPNVQRYNYPLIQPRVSPRVQSYNSYPGPRLFSHNQENDLSKSYLGNVVLPSLRRSLINTSAESEEYSNEGGEEGSNEEDDKGRSPYKSNVNIQSGITSINGKDSALNSAEVRRKVPEIFNKVLSDLGLN